MFGRLSRALRERREARALERHAIPDALWELMLLRYPFLARRSAEDIAELRRMCSLFLASKEFHGVGGFEVTDEIALAIAAQACLPVLKLGLPWYDGFVGIVVHEDEVVAPREVMDEDGIVHQYDEELVGEATQGGPLMIAWSAAAPTEFEDQYVFNVVIHEFAHVIDMRDGWADGVPPLESTEARERWIEVIDAEWQDFCERVDAGDETLIDPYGAEAIEEFFAVAVEAFFVAPEAMKKEQPALHRLLSNFFRQG
ncbi:zinc-dependent peptidase [Pelomonas sp. KK5]|uniref:M90 family metallopeptidase n=1 Tax=Pelomonas sp. KK5 TaxID=1855730 RepID=UPI00097C6651|nr:M90 family metallopeptidase [Pelomonas sp. KK5]